MNQLLRIAMLASLLMALSMSAHAQGDAADGDDDPPASAGAAANSYNWQKGPLIATFSDQATLAIPAGHAFLSYKEAQRLLRKLGNPDVRNVLGVVADGSNEWIVVVRFEKTGYIKDGDAKSWNVDALLESIRNNVDRTNEARIKRRVPAMEILGWMERPAYDAKQNRVTLAIAVRDKNTVNPDSQGINFNTYLLGREGYFSLNLVTGLQNIDRNKQHLTQLLSGLAFKEGKKYGDVKSKDKLAPFGLNELAAGSVPTRKPGLRGAIQWFFADYGLALLLSLIVLSLLAGGGYAGWRFWQKRKADVPPELSEQTENADEAAGAAHKDA